MSAGTARPTSGAVPCAVHCVDGEPRRAESLNALLLVAAVSVGVCDQPWSGY